MTPEERLDRIEALLGQLFKSDRMVLERTFQLADGRNIQLGKGTGTKIGTEATQKLSLYGVTPIVQQGAISAPAAPGATYAQADATSAVTAINSLRTALKNIGITA